MILPEIETQRFILRCLVPKMDLSQHLAWMRDVNSYPYIKSTNSKYTLAQLESYVNEVNSSLDSTMFGIFTKVDNLHIGNIKFHDINLTLRSCMVGFLIGNKEWQHKGVARESFLTATRLLHKSLELTQFGLIVDSGHQLAITSYLKMGFKEVGRLEHKIEMSFTLKY